MWSKMTMIRGTNYYIKGTDKHIGKSSSAGLFCWDCKCTLAIDGVKGITSGLMMNNCPFCGNKYHPKDTLNKGITEAMSFQWAIKPYELTGNATDTLSSMIFDALQGVQVIDADSGELRERDLEMMMSNPDVEIVDEYGREYSLGEFREEILVNCPLQFFSVGEVFC
jgi:hypothetical protein